MDTKKGFVCCRNYLIYTDPARLDADAIHAYLDRSLPDK